MSKQRDLAGTRDSSKLDAPADWSQPPEQEKVVAAKSTSLRQQEPAQRFLECVPYADASKLDRSTVRALRSKHRSMIPHSSPYQRSEGGCLETATSDPVDGSPREPP